MKFNIFANNYIRTPRLQSFITLVVATLMISTVCVSGSASDFSTNCHYNYNAIIETKSENLTLSPPETWSTVIYDEVGREVSHKIQSILPSLSETVSKLHHLPLPSNITAATFGFVLSKLTRFFYKTTVSIIPPAFLVLEALAQMGYIGDEKEGVVQWFREMESFSVIGECLEEYNLPSADEARPFVKLVVDFFFGRALVFVLGFSAAFLL